MQGDAAASAHIIEKVCWYYYNEGLTQQEIARLLGLTRLRVIKFLDEGRVRGVVSFQINRRSGAVSALEQRLLKAYALEDAYVIPAPARGEDLTDSLAKAATAYVNARLSRDAVINIGYGRTLSLTVNYLAATSAFPWTAVSLTGGVNNYLPNNVSDVFKARLYLYPAPLLMSSPELRTELRAQKDLMWIEKMAATAVMSLFSVGGLDQRATLIEKGLFAPTDFIYLKRLGAVGDILGHFIDKNGRIVDQEADDKLISTDLYALRGHPRTTVIAGGTEKTAIMKAVLSAGLAKVLITDEHTAEALANPGIRDNNCDGSYGGQEHGRKIFDGGGCRHRLGAGGDLRH